MFDISPVQIIIVLAIALLIFGPKRLPEMGRNLGKGIRDFRGGLTGDAPSASATPAASVEAPRDEPSLEQIVAQADAAETRDPVTTA